MAIVQELAILGMLLILLNLNQKLPFHMNFVPSQKLFPVEGLYIPRYELCIYLIQSFPFEEIDFLPQERQSTLTRNVLLRDLFPFQQNLYLLNTNVFL